MNPESHLAEQLHAAYPPPEENPDLTRAVLALRVRPRPSRARNALLMTAAAAAVVLVVAVALPRREPQASTSPSVTPVSSASETAGASPSPAAVPSVAALADRTWQIPGSRATFFLHGSQLLLSNGCQFGKAIATISANTVAITDLALSAGPVCTPDIPVIDAAFLGTGTNTAQSDSVRWAISEDRLTLSGFSDGASLTYIDAGAGQVEPTISGNTSADVAGLRDSTWTLPGVTSHLTLAAGTISASEPGCNVRIGHASITASQITIADTVLLFCPISTGAATSFSFRNNPLRWHLHDGLLLLTDGGGHAQQWVSVPATLTTPLIDHSWQVPGSEAGMFFGTGTVWMSTGCSGWQANVVESGDELLLSAEQTSSNGVCTASTTPIVQQGIFSTRSLRWSLSDHELTVADAQGHALTYLDAGPGNQTLPIPANTAADQKALANSSWVLPGTAGQLRIADGRIDGSIGVCNSIHGPVDISSTTLAVTHPDGPVVSCPTGPTMPMDAAASLSEPLRWHLEGGLLLLTNAKNQASQWVPAG